MIKTIRCIAGALLLTPLMAAQAQVVNGGFESGLTGWNTLGDASAFTLGGAPEGAAQLWLTTASIAFEDDHPAVAGALNRSGTAAAEVGVPGGLESFLGLQLGALDPDVENAVQATEGSAVFQTFNANAGDVLTFQWNFGTSEGVGADYGFVIVDGAVSRLGNPGDATLPGTFGNVSSTGFNTFSSALLGGGTHTVGFGVVDVTDYNVTSTLAIDTLQISAVPEMPALTLALVGLMGMGGWRRVKK